MMTKLLLVEDNLSIQALVRDAFAHEPFDIVAVNEAPGGLRQLQDFCPDLVLADAAMSGIDGFQLCQIIRETARFQHIPVVLLTSSFTAYDEAKGVRAGVTAHLVKPFEAHTLVTLAKRLVTDSTQKSAAFDTDAPPAALLEAPQPADTRATDNVLWKTPVSVADLTALQDLSMPEAPTNVDQDEDTTPVTVPTPAYPHEVAAAPASPQTEMVAATFTQAPDMPGALSAAALPQALGQYMLQIVQEACRTQLATALEKLTPQIIATVQHAVQEHLPALLEELLQREIDKLKHAVEHMDAENAPHHNADPRVDEA